MMKSNAMLSLLALIFMLAGSAHANPWNGANPQTLPGEYSVPVPSELEPYSAYPLAAVCWTVSAEGLAKLGYHLPEELTGLSTSAIELTGDLPAADGEFKMSGPHGDAQCTRTNGQVSCKVVYAALETDLAQATLLLAKKYTDLTQFAHRLTVSALFEHEPVGIVSFSETAVPVTPAPSGYGYGNW